MAVSKGVIAAVVVIIVVIVGVVAYYYTTLPTGVTEVKVGVLLPLSGSLAETGADLKRGIEFAVDEINSAGGIKNLGGD